MKAKIKSLADLGNNYNRFGRLIPIEEKEIDVGKFFNANPVKEQFIITRLSTDKKIQFELLKDTTPALDFTPVKKIEKVEEKVEINEPEIEKKPSRGRPARS